MKNSRVVEGLFERDVLSLYRLKFWLLCC